MQMNPSVTIERKRVDCSVLPKGWQRDEVRKSGSSANNNEQQQQQQCQRTRTPTRASSNNNNNKVDVFYYR